jgi:hypothetical protein
MVKVIKIASLISVFCLGLTQIQAIGAINFIVNQASEKFEILSNDPSTPDDNESKFLIYINEGTLNIKYDKPSELTNGEVIVYNLLGQELIRKRLESITLNQVFLTVQNTCYIVKISYSGKVHTQKVVPSIQ